MWSASHRGRAARHPFRAARSSPGGLAPVPSRSPLPTLGPPPRQVPLSRFLTSRRTYDGLLRIFHSCTHGSPQNVRRGGVTGLPHHRQIGCPRASRSGMPHWSAVTTRARLVLTPARIGRRRGGLQLTSL